MILMWFHLIPYTELPKNFRETNDAVWIDIDPGVFDPLRGHLMYNDFIDELEYAAECGFDAIWVNEHHANHYRFWWVKPLATAERAAKEAAA